MCYSTLVVPHVRPWRTTLPCLCGGRCGRLKRSWEGWDGEKADPRTLHRPQPNSVFGVCVWGLDGSGVCVGVGALLRVAGVPSAGEGLRRRMAAVCPGGVQGVWGVGVMAGAVVCCVCVGLVLWAMSACRCGARAMLGRVGRKRWKRGAMPPQHVPVPVRGVGGDDVEMGVGGGMGCVCVCVLVCGVFGRGYGF